MGRLSSTFDSPEKNDSLSEASNGPGLPETYKISKSEIEHASDAIGHGVSSTVYKGTFKNAVVALKKFTLDNPALPHNERLILRECTELLSFRHENIISCYGVCVSTGTLVLEFCEKILKIGGNKYTVHSLRQLIDCVAGAQKKIPYDLKLEALYQISSGLSYLHQRKLIHGDLKSANVLVTGTKQDEYLFKLCDLGQAHVDITSKIRTNMSFSSTLARKRTGTVSFEAPEVLFYLPKSVQSDIYSFAMVMFELLNPSLSHPWASDIFTGNIETVGLLIAEAVKSGKRPSFTEKPNKYTGLMIHCWAQCPSDRPTSTELNKNICSLREGDVQKEDERIAHQSELTVGLNSPLKRALLSTSNRPTPSTSIRRKLFNVPIFPVDDLANGSDLQTPGTPSNKAVPPYSRSGNSIKRQKRNWLDNREQVSFVNEQEEVGDRRSRCLTPVRSAPIRPPPTKLFADSFGDIVNDGKPNSPKVGTPEAASDDLSLSLPTNTEGEDNTDFPPEDLMMKWSGYASTRLGFALRKFQSLALFALHRGKDLIIIQATGSGKSACFQIPVLMLQPGEYAIVIVPTVALGQDHLQTFQELKVCATFLTATSTQAQYKAAIDCSRKNEKNSTVIILQPETLFGSRIREGIVKRLKPDRLKFIAIDEAHLVYEWADFRESFQQIDTLKDVFPCPIMALTATLKPSSVIRMKSEILRNPTIIKGSIGRENVAVHISPYTQSYEKVSSSKNAWYPVAENIRHVIKDELSIVYCSYTKDCDLLSLSLSQLGLKSFSYTGRTTSAKDKIEIYNSMKGGEIQVLVATKAFGMGVNLQGVRHVVHVGIPENLALWIQEFGRSGRDGKQSYAHLLICENVDLKRLYFWTKNSSEEERSARYEDFKDCWRYIACAFSGGCLREFQQKYFEDNETMQPKLCCTGCDIRSQIPMKKTQKEVRDILKVINCLNEKGMQVVYENKIIEFASGKQEEWLSTYFNEEELLKESAFGCLSMYTHAQAKLFTKGILRQCLSKQYLDLQFEVLPNSAYMAKHWCVTSLGSQVVNGSAESPDMPDPVKVTERLLMCPEKVVCDDEKKTRSRSKKGRDLPSQAIALMKNPDLWLPLTNKQEYEMLGHLHDTSKLLFVEDYTKLKCFPKKRQNEDYLWGDIHLTKCSSFPRLEFTLGDDHKDKSTFVLYRARCAGVKVCPGINGKQCNYALSNRSQENMCIYHGDAALVPSGPCTSYLVYIRAKSTEDKRRWLGLLSLTETEASHSHPMPAPSKVGSQANEMIEENVKKNPTLTPRDFAEGKGGFFPQAISKPTANKKVLAHKVNKFRKMVNVTGCSAFNIIENFEERVKNAVDEKDTEVSGSIEENEEIFNLCTPYVRWYDFSGDFTNVVLATPQMLQVLSLSQFVEADVTYNLTVAFPYLLNMVAYNDLTMQFQVVARVLMTSVSAKAYKDAFDRVFTATTNKHPDFDYGNGVMGWIVDFSLAQHEGLSANVEKPNEVIRGCNVHFQRMARKIGMKVAPTSTSLALFEKIANKIPYLNSKEDVTLAFDVLCGMSPLEEAEAFIELSEEELAIATTRWVGAKNWAKWWQKDRILKMFTKSFKDMTDAQWKCCPKTTNAVESLNKVSHSDSKSLLVTLEHYYRADRLVAFDTQAAQQGVPIGVKPKKRKKDNEKRRSRRLRVKLSKSKLENQDDKNSYEEDEINETDEESEKPPEADKYVGKKVWLYTVDVNKKSKKKRDFEWCEANIVSKRKNGNYCASYVMWPDIKAIIYDILDEKAVRFTSPYERKYLKSKNSSQKTKDYSDQSSDSSEKMRADEEVSSSESSDSGKKRNVSEKEVSSDSESSDSGEKRNVSEKKVSSDSESSDSGEKRNVNKNPGSDSEYDCSDFDETKEDTISESD